ncbi:10431_t:CDS:10 [Entrophospora sp. SA101]|nr:10431_t:CDS:10 [Entrophospora sp. SA101]
MCDKKKLWFQWCFAVVSSLLLGFPSALSFLKLTQEQPAMISTLSTIASLPVPDIYLAYNGTFTITCTKGSSSIGNKCLRSVSFALIIDCLFQHIYLTQNVSKEGDCNDYVTQPTRGDNPNLQYAGKFLPKDQISLFPKGIGNYDPWIEGSVAHTNNENEELFTESLGYANRYYLSGSLKVRKTIANTNLNFIGLSLGLETDYNTQNYIESKMQNFPKDDLNSPFIKLEISPQNFISEEFKEQRSNTVISVLGTIFGYYSVMMALYSFLFNPDKITLEDLLEKFKRKKKENDETNNTEIPTPGQVEVFPTISRATSSSNLTRLTQEQPAMISTLSTITSLPVPDIYLAYNGTFTITCTKGSSSIEGDCNDYLTQPTRGDNPNLQYAGKFLPRNQISLFPKGIGNYDPWIEGSVAHTNNENEELFTESLGYANRYYLSGGLVRVFENII